MHSYRNKTAALVFGALVGLALQPAVANDKARVEAGVTGSTSTTVDANRGLKATAADAAITAKVKSSLIGDELVKARNINVDTVGGIVKLNGSVKSSAEAQQAMTLAKQVNGVAEVQNNLTIQP